jgi:hypothetical protein
MVEHQQMLQIQSIQIIYLFANEYLELLV